MNLPTIATRIAVIFLLVCCFTSGCRPQVDYKPKPSPASAAPGRSGAGTATPDNSTPEGGNPSSDDLKLSDTSASQWLPELIAFDEFDGVHRGGWKEEGLGEWSGVAEERDGALVVTGDVDVYRALANPVKDGVLWYAVTMRMETPVTGVASVDGSPGPPKRFFKLGFSALEKPFTSQGFWMDPDRGTKIENTELQTFLTRYSFSAHNAEGYAARDNGYMLVDHEGMVFVRPRVKMPGSFAADRFSHLSLKKSGPEKLIVERVAIARTPAAALSPQRPAVARKPVSPDAPVVAEKPKPSEPDAKTDAGASPSATNEAKLEGAAGEPPAPNAPTGAESDPK